MAGGKPVSNFILGTISTGDGFYTILDPSQKGFGAIYALSLKNVAKKLSSFEYFRGVKVASHTGYLIPFVGMDGSKNFIGNGMNQCARYLEFKVDEHFEGYGEFAYENGYAIMSSDSHRSLEALLMSNKTLYDKVEQLGVHITEEVKHSKKFRGYLMDSESDSIITFAQGGKATS